MNQILVSSDHHANWEALEAIFAFAKDKNIPLVMNGDIIGDYNFDDLASELGLNYPFQIEETAILDKLGDEYKKAYLLYQQVKEHGEAAIISQVPLEMVEKAKSSITNAISVIESDTFQKTVKDIQESLQLDGETVSQNHTVRLQALYKVIVRSHAKRLAQFISKYKVKTYFLPGNHEPVNFVSVVHSYLKDKSLLVDLGIEKGVSEVNGVRIAGVSNVAALMGFLSEIYSPEQLNTLFSHQQGVARPILFKNVNALTLVEKFPELETDSDWKRIMPNGGEKFDVFFTHGQIGEGAWRDDKKCPESPTLLVAAMLSQLAQLTVDAHLHTSHQMKNDLGKPTIRGVGNVAYVVTKSDSGEISYEKQEFDAPYKAKLGMPLRDLDKFEVMISDLVWD